MRFYESYGLTPLNRNTGLSQLYCLDKLEISLLFNCHGSAAIAELRLTTRVSLLQFDSCLDYNTRFYSAGEGSSHGLLPFLLLLLFFLQEQKKKGLILFRASASDRDGCK